MSSVRIVINLKTHLSNVFEIFQTVAGSKKKLSLFQSTLARSAILKSSDEIYNLTLESCLVQHFSSTLQLTLHSVTRDAAMHERGNLQLRRAHLQ